MLEDIIVRGAREHNLKNINVNIPRDKLVVITGLSGSGKSSLAFDTIYAEGQRRYVESLSSYARQFLGQMEKPDLDSISGLSPAVSIDQKTTSKNPRSTVGTVTEIYDYLRLLFARVGIPHCPECGRVIAKQTVDQVADLVLEEEPGARAIILAPVIKGRKGEYSKLFDELRKQGFSRVRVDGEIRSLSEAIELNKNFKHDIDVVVDRLVLKEGVTTRLVESIQTATTLADGVVIVQFPGSGDEPDREESFSLALACPEHGFSIDELNPRDFSFNAPYGACPDCMGLGVRSEVDPKLLIPNPALSLAEGACKVISMRSNYYPQVLEAVANHLNVDIDAPFESYPEDVKKAFFYGLGDERVRVDYVTLDGRRTYWYREWDGLVNVVHEKIQTANGEKTKEKLEGFFSSTPCNTCHGSRLKPSVLAVTINDKNIYEVVQMPASKSLEFFEELKLTGSDALIGDRIVKEIRERLRFLVYVGLDYLTLDRATATLSGGEAQRIRLATQIGAGLMGVLYVLDEPSIGLHQRDNARLVETLKHLRDLGNTVIVVEHDEETIRSADYVIDMGIGAGEHGGEVVAAGTPEEIERAENSLTADYLSGRKRIEVPSERRYPERGQLEIKGVTTNNLKGVDASFELGAFTVVTGVSGSGKSSLITDTLVPALTNRIHRSRKKEGDYASLSGVGLIDKVIDIDQSPIGRTPRSNPATYIGVWDDIRALFASTPESKARGYNQGRFSFNTTGGRCEACKGDGQIKIEMHFLPDVYIPCEQCHGARYNRETLQVKYKSKSIADILDMTVAEALRFFENIPQIKRKLQTLFDVGLGYIRMGQPATTLSGGEAQRVKLASELQRKSTGKTLYILDEPTTGLHFDDVRQLLEVLQRLVDRGNTVVVIEHNLDVIKCADRVLDMGPEGGDGGGTVIAYGTPEEVAQCERSYTGEFLRKVLE